MSKELEDKMKPREVQQQIQDRVAETLNLIHDVSPLSPTGSEIEYNRKKKDGDKSYDIGKERDISMLTNIEKPLVYLIGLEKALSVTDPCEARAKFTEQLVRSSRSIKGWWANIGIEMMKAIRPFGEEEVQKGRFKRLTDWLGGKR